MSQPLPEQPPLDLTGTRTSSTWSSRPGNWDRLNLRAIFPSDNDLGIPLLTSPPESSQPPSRLIAYNDRNALRSPVLGDCVHFFLDDYRFETVWNDPQRCLSRLQRVGVSLTPDFSLYPEMPRIVQQWNIYRSRWCGAWMQAHGITVIPTVTWSDKRSHEYAFYGLATGGTVALSTVGIVRSTAAERALFADGLDAMIDIINPERIVVYGCSNGDLEKHDNIDLVFYPARRNR